jgi:hypothetical protein
MSSAPIRWVLPIALCPLQNPLLRMHWTKRKKLEGLIATHLLWGRHRVQCPPPGRPTVTITRRSQAPCDPDSGHGAKLVLDAMKRLGFIRDDSDAAIELVCKWERKRGKGEVVVELMT